MSERKPLYESPGEKGKRGFEDLECYQLALQVMADVHAFCETLPPIEKYDLYVQMRRASKGVTGNIGEFNETLARLIDARVLKYIDQPAFESLYTLIRRAEQSLNGFMGYVRRQKAGSQEFGDKSIHEDKGIYQPHVDGANEEQK